MTDFVARGRRLVAIEVEYLVAHARDLSVEFVKALTSAKGLILNVPAALSSISLFGVSLNFGWIDFVVRNWEQISLNFWNFSIGWAAGFFDLEISPIAASGLTFSFLLYLTYLRAVSLNYPEVVRSTVAPTNLEVVFNREKLLSIPKIRLLGAELSALRRAGPLQLIQLGIMGSIAQLVSAVSFLLKFLIYISILFVIMYFLIPDEIVGSEEQILVGLVLAMISLMIALRRPRALFVVVILVTTILAADYLIGVVLVGTV